ncbi:hypothetical protein DL762_003417 [Monosporascus cannonballus]|uniref:glutathione-specific gamma-glutamylcyclotransferase n=1 Tax=Monosporascus cannonballus TaxID=155416 RepID=A0ABY0HAT6_9PEZI|nr:hypothetical protein DL763_006452 [Monosporascus cannonballus]RYO89137.1 hypothetical protein DL762_003417 [Monosporascus cannonballus]
MQRSPGTAERLPPSTVHSTHVWQRGYRHYLVPGKGHTYITSYYHHHNSDKARATNSQDHRGTPEAPGRVVTLIDRAHWASLSDAHAEAPERVWGVAYRIRAEKVAEVKEYLDIREINGYTIHYAPFHPAAGGPSIRTLVYIGTPDNPQFTGPQDPARLAEHIHRSAGPSGANRDYLFGLERALDELSPESGDAHVTDLADRVRAIEARREDGAGGGDEAASHEFKKVDSVDEQEETEKT